MAAVDAGLFTLAIIGVLTSVVSTFYYLRIIKVMYFDEPSESFDKPLSRSVGIVMAVSTAVVLLFSFLPGPLLSTAKAAAVALFPQ